MNLLIVTQYYWPETFIITGMAEELVRRGHQVTVLTGFPNYPAGRFFSGYSPWGGVKHEMHEGVQIVRVPVFARGQGFARLALNYMSFIFSSILVSFFISLKKTDVIFCYAPSPATQCLTAVFLRWKLKKKLLFWVQDLWPESIAAVGAVSSKSVVETIGRVIRFIYERCDLLLIPSKGFRQSLLQWGAREEQIEVVPNWADPFPARMAPPSWVAELPVGFRVVFAGNLGKAQDLPTLIGAAEILKEDLSILWIVVGDGSEKEWLMDEVKRRGLNKTVFVLGRKPYDDMLAFFESSDALYVSLRNEMLFSVTIPSKVQAYMSSGKPLLASLSGEGAQLISEVDCGLTTPPESPELLAQTVLKLKALTIEERRRMGVNAQTYFAQNFEKKIVIDRLESLIQRMV